MLGPLLFQIYINDLPDQIDSSVYMYEMTQNSIRKLKRREIMIYYRMTLINLVIGLISGY